MDIRSIIVILITLAVAGSFLAAWMRRDKGIVPEDRLPEALHEPLNGRQGM